MDSRQWNLVSLGVIAAMLVGAVWAFWPPATQIKRGLDIQGGLSVILTAEKADVDAASMDRALLIVQERVNGLGVSEATVQREGATSILVQLPGVRDAEAALKILGSTGQLEFVDWNSIPASEAAAWDDYETAKRSGSVVKEPKSLTKGSYTVLLTGDVVTNALAEADTEKPGNYAVSMQFNTAGRDTWAKVTTEYSRTNRRVAIVLDGRVQSAPQVISAIKDGNSQITGTFTASEAKRLATVLQTGALPVSLKFSDTQEVGPTLGQASLDQGLLAAIAGILIVAVYLGIYYRGLGVLSWVGLAIFAVLYLGILAVLSRAGAFALSLPGIAGIVLSIGLAADTSILIFERFLEEVGMGRSPRTAAKSLVSAIFIYAIAIGPVRGFALTLILGLITDLTVGILFTRPMVMVLAEKVIPKMPALFGLKGGAARG
jgi:protein-export membrane protein SecD